MSVVRSIRLSTGICADSLTSSSRSSSWLRIREVKLGCCEGKGDAAHSFCCFSRLAVSRACLSCLKKSLLLDIASSNFILIFRYFFLMVDILAEFENCAEVIR